MKTETIKFNFIGVRGKLVVDNIEGIDELSTDQIDALVTELQSGRERLAAKLSPCPFCERRPKVESLGIYEGLFHVRCHTCEIRMRSNYTTVKEAVNEWNKKLR